MQQRAAFVFVFRIVVVLLLAGCGRLAFDPLAVGDTGRDAAGDAVAVATTIPPGAKIWLKMETDPTVSTVSIVDSAGGHRSACVGSCPANVSALHALGYQFAMNEIDVAPAADLDSSAGFTAAIWVQLTQLPASTACVWSKPFDIANVYDTFTLCFDPAATTTFDSETPGGIADSENGPALTLHAWHHLAMTWDGTTKRGYVDGIEVVTKVVQIGAANIGLALGAENSAYYTPAITDDALYYTRTLSAAEIAHLATP